MRKDKWACQINVRKIEGRKAEELESLSEQGLTAIVSVERNRCAKEMCTREMTWARERLASKR